jgi:hypothetical protein
MVGQSHGKGHQVGDKKRFRFFGKNFVAGLSLWEISQVNRRKVRPSSLPLSSNGRHQAEARFH